MTDGRLYRLAAFPVGDQGGNPAGVWIGASLPDPAYMQRIANEVGYSETAFVAPESGDVRTIRYFSPRAEVSFCGHATIAAAVAIGHRDGAGRYRFSSLVGDVDVEVGEQSGRFVASLTSVEPRHEPASVALIKEALALLGWRQEELDPSIPIAKAYAGAWHLVIAAGSEGRLANLDYAFDAMTTLMLRENLTTLQLVWRERADLIHSRNPFPVGGVVEDPATGAAAAALGGYLRDAGLLQGEARLEIRQGEVMGRPSLLVVDVPASGGIKVSGAAIDIRQGS
ncbi:PhzF family phenazine biosynthesis protein [Dokdonella sp.]|uniref:PhzF family phenazine biosynthesis protein n=1 Tax=Dokdonella sp. TaxID=2291710 RepID=UPI003C31F366